MVTTLGTIPLPNCPLVVSSLPDHLGEMNDAHQEMGCATYSYWGRTAKVAGDALQRDPQKPGPEPGPRPPAGPLKPI